MAKSKVGGFSSRKMAKKGQQASLQIEVNNDEEWDALLEKEGLVIVDVYSAWCGPSLGMFGNLKKFKLENGGEFMHLAMAKADTVTVLNRFQGRSEPTWLFIGSGHLVKVMFGSNAPKLIKEIGIELEKELKVMNGDLERVTLPFDEPTEEELQKARETEEKRAAEAREEAIRLEEQFNKIKRITYERIARETVHSTVVLFFPHTIKEPTEQVKKRVCQAALQLMGTYDTVGMAVTDQLDIDITENELPDLFFNTDMEIPESLLAIMKERSCLAALIQESSAMYTASEESQVEEDEDAPPPPTVSELLGTVEEKVAQLIYGGNDPHNPTPESVAGKYIYEDEGGHRCPGVWTPLDFISKGAAIKILFPKVVENLGIKEEELPKPSYVMAFDANRAREVLDTAHQFSEDIRHIAYFDSQDATKAKRIAKTIYELDRLPISKSWDAKMVIALQKTRSDPMLVLAQLGPSYISPDTNVGIREVEMFFPRKVMEEEEPDPWAEPPPRTDDDYMVDDDGNHYVEELRESPEAGGEAVLMKRIVRWADGSTPETDTYLPLHPEDEPPAEGEGAPEGEGGEGAAEQPPEEAIPPP